jgi:glucan phosphoethanolaminetransferase (alkaline phosphatase superfamily)
MKEKFTAFINGLITYDYILFGSVFGVFVLLIIFAILLRKRLKFSIFVLLLSFLVLFIGPTIGYKEMHKYLFKNSVTLISQKKLTFTPAIVIRGSLKNESKFDFKRCKITASVHKASKNKYKNYVYRFKILKKMSILEENIAKGETRAFKLIVEPFNYKKDYNITVKGSCE